ncbi:hypothetical protein EMIHUDRAFT_199915 [Emiliania huxleyi CCMP1516]|uniref:Fe2OG dioxygenase domain-containing protein n=2 Tax=Emiliania huxleyi TaxID=2903 RepID=A0A0D3KUM1_EMIH1|nr:hypothetical protein EMIHUDRAFT_199915 [Emiliania huxleyi CCMP1516]EOD39456.1 hypothetical protein EMIHUDRAFT_199915 [Emiliania huxleyi CCMP1516]|eukprot:XP_005791885.1 hypothetical protein EMIHUDRAFT_199915 [Emiliania huxleyi CCMP1516]
MAALVHSSRATAACSRCHLVLRLRAGARGLSSDVAARYEPQRLHPRLFEPSEVVSSWLDPAALALLQDVELADLTDTDPSSVALRSVATEAREIYSFPLLSPQACRMLVEEVEHFQLSGLPARRPNSMNNYGLILNEIGLRASLSRLQAAIAPLARAVFPAEGRSLDDHHSFVDDSDVTLNVCLGSDSFEASGLTFCGDMGSADHRLRSYKYAHRLGRAVMHLGRRRHGADDITKGHRLNLIMWNYNKEFRASPEFRARSFAREGSPPDAECISYTHDRDYEAVSGVQRPAPHLASSAWCPPPPAEYDGFGSHNK